GLLPSKMRVVQPNPLNVGYSINSGASITEGITLPLQRHFSASTKFARVKSRFCGRKQRGKAAFCTPINPCARSVWSRSVAVGLIYIDCCTEFLHTVGWHNVTVGSLSTKWGKIGIRVYVGSDINPFMPRP